MDVEHALHGAIGRQEMRLYHQPIVDLETGHLSGFEALIRWQRDGVIVPPADFIPIAEETGIIKEIGAWALREALCELQGWINDGVVAPGTTTSVNVSPRQILDPDFADGRPRRARAQRRAAAPAVARDDRVDDARRARPGREHSAPGPCDGRAARARRLRHRLLVAVAAPALPDPADQDRPGLRAGRRRTAATTARSCARSSPWDSRWDSISSPRVSRPCTSCRVLRDLGCDKAQGYLISRPVPAEAMRSTMVALDELTGLALFANDHDNRSTRSPERWLEPVGAGFTAEPMVRPLATRPLG